MKDVLVACWTLLRMSWRQSPLKITVAVLLMLSQAAALPLAAPALGRLTDAAIAGDRTTATVAAFTVAGLVLASLTFGHFAHVAYFELGELNVLRLQRELIELSNGTAGLEHHDRPEYADKIEVVNSELERAGSSSMTALLSGLSLAVATVMTATLLAMVNPWLILLPLTAVPPIVLGGRAERLLGKVRESTAGPTRLARHLFELATNAAAAKELRIFDLQLEVRERHRDLWRQVTRRLWRGELRAGALRIAGQVIFATAYIVGMLLVLRDALTGRRSVGDVVLVIALAAQVNSQLTSAVTLLQGLQRVSHTLASFRWVRRLVEHQASPAPTAPLPDRIDRGITFHNVSFRYPGTDRAILEDVTFDLPAGSTVAIVGENGAGKTTLVKLLARFYEPTEGVIRVDGVDVRRLGLDEWRSRIAAGFQDFARLELIAQETVGVGDLDRVSSPAAVGQALRRARGEDIVDRLEEGLRTPLGLSMPGGTELSGGQWQKLALGRAMMRDEPLLLILDEPTSALDPQAEHLLFEQYAAGADRVGELTGAVTVLVSHRFSTVRMADLILVVSAGRVIESGSHSELVAAGGLYAELYEIQATQYG